MELKTYQRNVIGDLTRFLALLREKENIHKAYDTLWNEKNVMVGVNGMPAYRSNIPGVPEVCFKVPTGGGKTFIAACSVKPIFDSIPNMRTKAVVWLVPSDAILTQTYKALSNTDHDYRRRLNRDFGGRVDVYSKEQLLNGQGFNPTAVTEQLSVFVLSYDSFRTSKKDGRKAFQENGNLAEFPKRLEDKSMLLPDTDDTALIQVVRSLNPVVIVDESHHATSTLSVEMLKNFNPCFVLDLTATPKIGSNIISFVDAAQLKKENMVKLPVIVYNRRTQRDVYADAINIRQKLETQARIEQQTSGRYIRPVVLLQAQPRVSADSTTYDKIKKELVEAGIPEKQIAIKTGDRDELKNQDLNSPDCPIRYIITVNALKEGWDCPFAYVLATVANRTSTVDVEQILGRVLRLPGAAKNASDVLNLSYVITSSADFHETLERVVKGLNNAGFSRRDCRVQEDIAPAPAVPAESEPVQLEIQEEEDIPSVDTGALREQIAAAMQPTDAAKTVSVENDELFVAAIAQNEAYQAEINNAEETAINLAPSEVRDKMNVFHMNAAFEPEAAALALPQFVMEVGPSIFTNSDHVKLELDHLTDGFTLKDKDVQIDFSTVDAEMARVDIDDARDAVPKAWKITGFDSDYFKEWFNAQPSNIRLAHCKGVIRQKLSKLNCVNDKELQEYIDRAVSTMTEDQISDFEQSPFPYMVKVEDKVKALLDEHRSKIFDLWLEQGKIICRPIFSFPSTISPTTFTSALPKSLYSAEEGNMNDYEHKVVWELSALGNIKWWHRNISRLGFQINGSVHAFPDIIAMTISGKLLMIETKGDHLDNAESKEKARIGNKWASLAGRQYRYYMVFQTKQPDYPGAYSLDRFMEIVKGL